ncbi:MAG TPA: hypothetical protein VF618_00885 [Thermoanaerobaculia bacterium]
MVRSILPSKNREAARAAKVTERRRVRRAVRTDLRHEDYETSPVDFLQDAFQSPNVYWRRGGDKLNHFLRWCEAITAGMTAVDALSYVRSLLPRNLIGEHAYEHWKEVCTRDRRYGSKSQHHERRRRELQSRFDQTRCALRGALREDPTLLGRLNADIKRGRQPDPPRRLLRGMHDVDAFVQFVLYGGPDIPHDCWVYNFIPVSHGVEYECLMRAVNQ